MNIKVNGKIRHIGEDQEVSGEKGDHQFKIVIIETLDNSYLAIHAWDDSMDKAKEYKVGQIVELDCRLESHRNKKKRELWYHKLLLK